MSRPANEGDPGVRPALVQIRTFPSGDRAFRAWVRAALARSRTATPAEVQAAVRERYPASTVRAQHELARRGDALVWYAFRYGSIAEAPNAVPFDWDAPGIAEGIVDDARRFVDCNDALSAILEVPRAAVVGRTLESFANPDDPTILEDMASLWMEFKAAGEAESSIRFNRLDGRPRELAYRIVADDPEPGRHRLKVRELEQG